MVLLSNYKEVAAQRDSRTTNSYRLKTFGVAEGFKVHSALSMVFDDSGWLWISGGSLELSNSGINSRNAIIQRYDGNSFYTVPLPDISKGAPSRIALDKRQDGLLYALFEWVGQSRLFILDPDTFEFEEIELPVSMANGEIDLFEYHEDFLVFMNDFTDSYLYKLDDSLKFSLLSHQLVINRKRPHIPIFIDLDDHFIINDTRSGVHRYHRDGSYDAPVSITELESYSGQVDYVLNINTWFKQDGAIYAQFSESGGYYRYDPEDKTWLTTTAFSAKGEKRPGEWFEERVFTDALDNRLRMEFVNNTIKLSRFVENRMEEIPSNTALDFFPKVSSRDLGRELYMVHSGVFYHFIFRDKNVSSFLPEKSIRGILEVNSEELLVATQRNGWFIINPHRQQVRSWDMTLNGSLYLPTNNCGIFQDDKGYWSNYNHGIIYADKKTGDITSFVYYPVSTMVADETSIYYGTFRHKLMRFDKEKRQNIVLAETPDFESQDIVKVGHSIYVAGAEGLLIYENGKLAIFTPNEDPNDSFLLSLDYSDTHGLLAGSRSGKLFRFDLVSKTFQLLYQDEVQASIASVLFDDMNRIWINTYRGIVLFDPDTHATVRYSIDDGFSFHECNRYSAIKTSDGHLVVGTLKGVNYFHPNDIYPRPESMKRLAAWRIPDDTLDLPMTSSPIMT